MFKRYEKLQTLIQDYERDTVKRFNVLHIHLIDIKKEVEKITVMLSMLTGNNEPQKEQKFTHSEAEKLRQLQRMLDAQVGVVTESPLDIPKEFKDRLK